MINTPPQRPAWRLALLGAALTAVTATAAPDRLKALSPEAALASFRLESGLEISLVAAEPLVIDPVAFAFDETGGLYVVEGRGYPDPIAGEPTTEGRVARLEDTDQDGRFDRRTEFATGFTYPNGVLPWRGGVFVTCAPDIVYLQDTDGDGVADIRRVVLTGFSDSKTSQIRMSHPVLGLDGWVYVTSGLNEGKVSSPLHPERPPVAFSPTDSRFHPDTLEFQTTGGRGQFGLSFDPFGRRFICSNRHPVRHVVLERSHLQRNPHLPFTETMQDVSPVEAEAKVFPISGASTTADFIPELMGRSHTGTFTSACGVEIFLGTALTPGHVGNAFICEPAQNLIQRQILRPDGVSFRSEPAYDGREFLASSDEWFRPVFLQHGPDGALYLADMHRRVIDHAQYVPEGIRPTMDFQSGKDSGRIYRIARAGFGPRAHRPLADFAGDSMTGQLCDALNSAEEWERRTAHRLLLERADPAATAPLKGNVLHAPQAESRVRSLWLLHSLGRLDLATLMRALRDKAPGVREQAVLLTERACHESEPLAQAVAVAANDEDMRVRLAAALVLGSMPDRTALPALARIAARDGADRWIRAAVLSGVNGRLTGFLDAFRASLAGDERAADAVMQDLGRLFGVAATLAECRQLFSDVLKGGAEETRGIVTTLGLVQGLAARTEVTRGRNVLRALLPEGQAPDADRALERFIGTTAAFGAREDAPTAMRIAAAGVLGYTDFDRAGAILVGMMDARQPIELQLEAVSALTRFSDPRAAHFLTGKKVWNRYTPRTKTAVISALVSKSEFIEVLLQAINDGVVKATDIPSVWRQRLMKHAKPDIAARANELFAPLEGGDRMKVYQSHLPLLREAADPDQGKAVFLRVCSACHTLGGVGGKVGPDLSGVRNQPAEALLLHIIVPNYEVLPAYQTVTVERRDGGILSGWMVAETDNSITLRTAHGTEETVLRPSIQHITNAGISLMPDGLEQAMTRSELAALIAYLKSDS